MVSTTTNQEKVSPIFYQYEGKAEIRSIEDVYPEYTNYNNSAYLNSLLNILYNNIIIIIINDSTIQKGTDTNILLGDFMSKYYINKNEIKIFNHLYKFTSDFMYSIIRDEDGFIAENEYFNIFGYGDTVEEAEKELYEYVNDLWECYAEEDDKNLDESAIKLKEKLLGNIRKIY